MVKELYFEIFYIHRNNFGKCSFWHLPSMNDEDVENAVKCPILRADAIVEFTVVLNSLIVRANSAYV